MFFYFFALASRTYGVEVVSVSPPLVQMAGSKADHGEVLAQLIFPFLLGFSDGGGDEETEKEDAIEYLIMQLEKSSALATAEWLRRLFGRGFTLEIVELPQAFEGEVPFLRVDLDDSLTKP